LGGLDCQGTLISTGWTPPGPRAILGIRGKQISILPSFYVLVTSVFGNQRYGVGALLVFFVVGGLILMGADEEAGVPAQWTHRIGRSTDAHRRGQTRRPSADLTG
jgi:hypothetical protein